MSRQPPLGPGPSRAPTGARASDGDAVDRENRRRGLQRGVVILPSAFTLGNLFFGVYSIVESFRGELVWASWFVVVAALLDMFDGRVARFTRTGSAFGSELDSLVDAVSFGVAPGFLLYTLFFQEGTWSWLISFVYVAAVVVRLARFNVEQAGRAKSHFHGLPSPTAGMILATYYPFSRTPLFQTYLAGLPWHQVLAVSTVLIAVLMLSHVPYFVVPRIGFRSARGLATTGALLVGLVAAVTVPSYFFFPLLVLYTAWGFLKSVLLGLLDRLPEQDPLLDREEEADEAEAEVRALDYSELAPARYPEERERRRMEEEGEIRDDTHRNAPGAEGIPSRPTPDPEEKP